jgi:L-aminopeptidase/D-esterase-like protein
MLLPAGATASNGLTAVPGIKVGHHTLTKRPTGCTVVLAEAGAVAAARAATDGPVSQGNVGAGAGATVGKSRGPGRAMKGGIGTTAIALPSGLVVAALVAVNALGDVVDPANGRVVAGVLTPDGKRLADVRVLLRAGAPAGPGGHPENTTLAVVATNAILTKAHANKIAQMAHDGLARAIAPAHTPCDGDTVLALATGARGGEVGDDGLVQIGSLAAEALADAIVRGATQATGVPGFPAARDLAGSAR